MINDEDNLWAEFKKLVQHSKENIEGDCPSRDDVLHIYALEYITGLRKKLTEKDYALDLALSRVKLLEGGSRWVCP